MHRIVAALVFCIVVPSLGFGQIPAVKPMHVEAGSNLTFYLMTRLEPSHENAADSLPRGTQISIRISDPIDSASTRDGSEFHGVVTSQVISSEGVIIHSGAEVRGVFALLRSRTHPNGFRYELLITEIVDGGKSLRLTASLNTSFTDASTQSDTSKTTQTPTKLDSLANASDATHR